MELLLELFVMMFISAWITEIIEWNAIFGGISFWNCIPRGWVHSLCYANNQRFVDGGFAGGLMERLEDIVIIICFRSSLRSQDYVLSLEFQQQQILEDL